MISRLFFSLLLFAATFNAQTLEQLSFDEGQPAFNAIFNPTVGGLEASLAIRYLYIQAIARYEIAAACQPVALSFFGTKDPITGDLCTPLNRAIIRAYTLFRIYLQQFPTEALPFGEYLRSIGLFPMDSSADMSTTSGFANFLADRANEYLSTDGWNSQGNVSLPVALRKRYTDTTGFVPANKAETPVDLLPMPLRWQPLEEASGSTGGFKSQVFNTPQLGTATPLVITRGQVMNRRAASPYSDPDRPELSPADRALMLRQLQAFFRLSRGLTIEQRFLARWWENKRISLGSFLPFYSNRLGLSEWQETFIQLAQFIAQHDSIVVAWKEKVRINAVRPTTMIHKFFSGQLINVFISEENGAGRIPGVAYKPLLPVQSHAEFPSGSAMLCTTGLDALQTALDDVANISIPPYEVRFPARAFGFPHREEIFVRFETLRRGAEICGLSRLWGGVHFPPSVDAGERLSIGIGRRAYKQVAALVAGEVPQSCSRCL